MAPELVSPLCRETSQLRGPQFYQLLVAEVLSGAGGFARCGPRVGYWEALEEPAAMGSTPCETPGYCVCPRPAETPGNADGRGPASAHELAVPQGH